MATTTNYAWETPDDTDLVKDGALAIRTLGSSIDTTTKALNPSTTLGDIEYRSSTANTNTRLAIGTTGQVLTVAGGVPSWATPAAGGGGKVLQVIQATNATAVNTSATSYSSTGLSASITPSATSSKVLVFVHTAAAIQAADRRGIFTIFRGTTGGTDLSSNTNYGLNNASTGSGDSSSIYPLSMNYLDSPSTTSSQTYTVGIKSDGGGQIGTSQVTSTMILMEIGA
jgi:hypothetical protein